MSADSSPSSPAGPLFLGIETSCDDTACAVVDGGGRVLSSVVSSQLAAHRPYGGVVPEIASREHLTNWPAVSAEALRQAGCAGLGDLDGVAATRGPGLVGSLLVGLSLGRSIAYALDKPFYAVHHLEAHLYSPFLRLAGEAAEAVPARLTALVVSGGHTALYAVDHAAGEERGGGDPDGGGSRIATLAETRDDAMGEVFDKVGKRLGLPYPQGPLVDRLAELGDPEAVPLPVPKMGDGSLDFSFSGLKSEALRTIERLEQSGVAIDLSGLDLALLDDAPDRLAGDPALAPALDLLAGFRVAAVAQVLDRVERLHAERPAELLAVSGGAAANRLLRRRLAAWAEKTGVALRLVPLPYSGDNAAMIAYAALLRQRRGDAPDDPLAAEAASRIPI